MRLSSLRRFLDSEIPAGVLISEVDAELSAIRYHLQELGRSIPIPVGEDCDVEISRADVAFLCGAFLRGEIDAVLLAFIADVIQLADRVSIVDPWVAEAVAECTDPQVQGEFTVDKARALVSSAGV